MRTLFLTSCTLVVMLGGCTLLPRREVHVDSSRFVIVPPRNNDGGEAVRELSEYLSHAFTHPVPILETCPKDNAACVLQLELDDTSNGKQLEPSYTGTEKGVLFRARSGRSLHRVVCQFIIRECGGVWLWPGPSGTYCPKRTSLNIPQGKHPVPNVPMVTFASGTEGREQSIAETKRWLRRLGCRISPDSPQASFSPLGAERRAFLEGGKQLGQAYSTTPQFDLAWLWGSPYNAYAWARLLGDRRVKLSTTRREFVSAFGLAADDVNKHLAARVHTEKQNPALSPHTMKQTNIRELECLHSALNREDIKKSVSRRLQYLIALQEHRMLTVQAQSTLKEDHITQRDMMQTLDVLCRLADMRKTLAATFPLSLRALWHSEGRMGDPAGQEFLRLFETTVPVVRLPSRWLWRPDPNDCGVTQEWWRIPRDRLIKEKQWRDVFLNQPWDEQNIPESKVSVQWAVHVMHTPARLQTHELFLNFRSLGGTPSLFLNGQRLVLEPALGGDILTGTFRARLSGALNEKDEQMLFLRIEKTPEQKQPYGLCSPVWVSAESNP